MVRKKNDDDKTPRSWSHSKTGISGKFNVINNELARGVPDYMQPKARERVKLYRQCLKALENKPVTAVDAGFVTGYLPWNVLSFPPGELGREKPLDFGHCGYILSNFRPASMDAISVSIVPITDDNGVIIDAVFIVTDGWHRRSVLLELAYRDRPQDIYTGENVVMLPVQYAIVDNNVNVAQAFTDKNKYGKKTVNARDAWRNLYHGGDADAVYAVKLAAEYGFDATSPKGSRNKQAFPNGAVVNTLINGPKRNLMLSNETVVRTALSWLSNPECTALYEEKTFLAADWFGGLCFAMALFALPGYTHPVGLKYLFSRSDLVSRIKEIHKKMSRTSVIQTLNLRTRKEQTAAGLDREENDRYLWYAASIIEFYRECVPPPHKRNAGWDKCPAALRELLWEAPEIENANERNRFIAAQNAKLSRRSAHKNSGQRIPRRKSLTR